MRCMTDRPASVLPPKTSLRALTLLLQSRPMVTLLKADGTEVAITPEAERFSVESLRPLVGGHTTVLPLKRRQRLASRRFLPHRRPRRASQRQSHRNPERTLLLLWVLLPRRRLSSGWTGSRRCGRELWVFRRAQVAYSQAQGSPAAPEFCPVVAVFAIESAHTDRVGLVSEMCSLTFATSSSNAIGFSTHATAPIC